VFCVLHSALKAVWKPEGFNSWRKNRSRMTTVRKLTLLRKGLVTLS
jgi:hypothetical protein